MTEFPQPVDGSRVPRFAGIPTFMRLPLELNPAKLDIALVGVPFDGERQTARERGVVRARFAICRV